MGQRGNGHSIRSSKRQTLYTTSNRKARQVSVRNLIINEQELIQLCPSHHCHEDCDTWITRETSGGRDSSVTSLLSTLYQLSVLHTRALRTVLTKYNSCLSVAIDVPPLVATSAGQIRQFIINETKHHQARSSVVKILFEN